MLGHRYLRTCARRRCTAPRWRSWSVSTREYTALYVLYRTAVMLLRRCGVEPDQLEVRVNRTTLHETMVALTPGPIRKAWTYDIALEVPPTE